MNPRPILLLLLILSFPAAARADRHKAFFGGVYADRSSAGGFTLGIDSDLFCRDRPFRRACPVTWTTGIAYAWGTHDGRDLDQATITTGLRFTRDLGTVNPFVQFQVGRIRQALDDERASGFALALGGGVDVSLKDSWGLRVQAEAYRGSLDPAVWYPQFLIAGVYGH